MTRINLRITAAIAIAGRAPGAEFQVAATDGVPSDLYWRRRIEDGEAVIVPESVPEAEPAPAAPARKASAKKD